MLIIKSVFIKLDILNVAAKVKYVSSWYDFLSILYTHIVFLDYFKSCYKSFCTQKRKKVASGPLFMGQGIRYTIHTRATGKSYHRFILVSVTYSNSLELILISVGFSFMHWKANLSYTQKVAQRVLFTGEVNDRPHKILSNQDKIGHTNQERIV